MQAYSGDVIHVKCAARCSQNAAAIVVRLDQWLSTGGPRHASRVGRSAVLERSSGPQSLCILEIGLNDESC